MSAQDKYHTILSDDLTHYLETLHGDSPEPARSMEAEATEREFPIVGPQVGRLLELMAGLIDPDCIVELGSGFGYSAFWFARGSSDATIHLTDHDAENLTAAEEYLAAASVAERCRFHPGDALESARAIEEPIDLVFVDIDKEEYPGALEWAENALASGGWLIADNVLREGKVVDPDVEDTSAQAIRTFNERLYSGPWTTSVLPLRDGVAVARYDGDNGDS